MKAESRQSRQRFASDAEWARGMIDRRPALRITAGVRPRNAVKREVWQLSEERRHVWYEPAGATTQCGANHGGRQDVTGVVQAENDA